MTENVLFVRSEEDENNPWDDTLLIKAYDAALAKVKKDILKEERKKGNPSTSRGGETESSEQPKWRGGMPCRAPFTDDGVTYEAVIVKIMAGSALVRYYGYGNEEIKTLDELEPSLGKAAIRAQKRQAKASKTECHVDESMETETADSESDSVMSAPPAARKFRFKIPAQPGQPNLFNLPSSAPTASFHEEDLILPPPPPPPPGLFESDRPPGDDETLYAMLMSWYMSGYHTGYFAGRKASKSK